MASSVANGEEGSDSEENIDDVMCEICGGTPCDWVQFGEELMEQVNLMYDINSSENREHTFRNSTIRKSAYRMFTYMKYGHLGKGNRIPIASCVVDRVRSAWPELDANYMPTYALNLHSLTAFFPFP